MIGWYLTLSLKHICNIIFYSPHHSEKVNVIDSLVYIRVLVTPYCFRQSLRYQYFQVGQNLGTTQVTNRPQITNKVPTPVNPAPTQAPAEDKYSFSPSKPAEPKPVHPPAQPSYGMSKPIENSVSLYIAWRLHKMFTHPWLFKIHVCINWFKC